MNPSEFLGAVCPDGLVVTAVKVTKTNPRGKSYTTFKHGVSQGTAQLLQKIEQIPNRLDIYFALASFKQGFHTNEKGKTVLRVRDNVDELKALWFDIDFKDGYGDEATTVKAIQSHCKQTGLPAPSILVNSGNGLHAYWPFEIPIPVARWQALADAFKDAAKMTGLQADLVCTADACRILRPPGTQNNKDPDNPKPVVLRYASGRLFKVEDLEACLITDQSTLASTSVPSHLKPAAGPSDEFTGSNGSPATGVVQSSFGIIQAQCAFAKCLVDTHGRDSSEPEWKDALQLLKHCEDGELFLHDISDGHPDYDPEEVREKFEQRKANTAGPTLCATFAQYRPEICHACPHWGKVKTPVHLGQADNKPVVGLPPNYRIAKKGGGIQKLLINIEDGTKEWVGVLRHNLDNLRITRSVQDNTQELTLDWWVEGGKHHQIEIPGGMIGNVPKMREHCAMFGFTLVDKEAVEFAKLMAIWIEQLQRNKRETKVTEQLGWIVERNEVTDEEVTIGFSCGSKAYMADGTEEGGVRVKSEYESIAKYFEPKGSYDVWRSVAQFITDQNYPAFTAVLATAFAAPLIRFTGEQGALVSLFSQESGVGKSSAMKIAQSVWGSPIHGINSVNDTRNSVTRKIGFLNNLPAYWDELRGEGTMDEFCELAFQITQGKEKSRLDSSARLRTSVAWCTMMVAASNDSIFDALGNKYKSTDAGMARVFEIAVQPTASDKSPAEISAMIDRLQINYGHAGRAYAKWCAEHITEVEEIFGKWRKWCDAKYNRKAVERFWFAVMVSMLTGATIASKAGIVNIDVKKLADYLGRVLAQLRARTSHTVDSNSAMELIALYEQAHQDRILTVKSFPTRKENTRTYEAEIVGQIPQSNKIIIWRSQDDGAIRFSLQDFNRWLLARGESPTHVIRKLKKEHHAIETKSKLALGTKLALPRMQVLEVPYQ